MGTIQIKRGLSTKLPTSAAVGELLYTTDTKRFYVGNGEGVNRICQLCRIIRDY